MVFSPSYAWNELRRRIGRTIVTAVGLAAGVGLVMGIVGVSAGLSDAQNKVLSPLGSVGTDIIVTRTVAATTSTATTTTTLPTFGGGGFSGAPGGGGGGGFFARGIGGAAGLNASASTQLAQANASVITDLAKLGKPGTQYTHDFFVPGTLITFPSQAVSIVSKLSKVLFTSGAAPEGRRLGSALKASAASIACTSSLMKSQIGSQNRALETSPLKLAA